MYGTFTLTGRHTTPSGKPHAGSVVITPNATIRDTAGDVVMSGAEQVKLDETGAWSIVLPCDSPELNPAEGIGYSVGYSLYSTAMTRQSFYATADMAGSTLDVSEIVTVSVPTPLSAIVGPEGPEGPAGTTTWAGITDKPTATDLGAATAAQGAKADTAVQPATVDSTVAAKVADTSSSTRAALNASYARRGAPNVTAPLLIATPVTITKTGTSLVMGKDSATGLYYGNSTANGHYITSPDLVTWTDRTYSPVTYTPNPIGYEFDATYMYAYSTTGKVWRAPKNVFNGWVEISVPDRGPLTTGRPGSLLALGSGVLLYGNYTGSGTGDGSHIWRSPDAGATWSKVVSNPSGKHVHAIRRNPATGVIWASVGDAGWQGTGLYKSTDNGLTWTLMSTNEYGIDMVFTAATEGVPALVILEGDGSNRPHLVAFPQDGSPGDKTFPLVWFTGPPSDATSTRGTVRGILLTPNKDIVYWTTTESGAVGTKAGLWIAQAPYYTRAILLADTTGAEPPAYPQAFTNGSIVQTHLWTFPLPTFGTY